MRVNLEVSRKEVHLLVCEMSCYCCGANIQKYSLTGLREGVPALYDHEIMQLWVHLSNAGKALTITFETNFC